MPATLCKVMYLSAVIKVPSSRGSCTSRSHPHFSHASDIHWGGSELVVMSASFQNLARGLQELASGDVVVGVVLLVAVTVGGRGDPGGHT
jgi:hypothetical protein